MEPGLLETSLKAPGSVDKKVELLDSARSYWALIRFRSSSESWIVRFVLCRSATKLEFDSLTDDAVVPAAATGREGGGGDGAERGEGEEGDWREAKGWKIGGGSAREVKGGRSGRDKQ